ncbi:MAG: hypothetical protein V3U52_00885 [Thermoplasmata archaeon]
MNRLMPRATNRNAWAILGLSFALLLILVVIPPVFDLKPPLDSAEAVQSQREPSSCEAVGNNWTSCDSAASSDDTYAVASDGRGATQYARPDSDVGVTNWTDSSGDGVNYTKIDETAADDDTTYTQTDINPSDGDDAEFGLSDVIDPQTSGGHILRYRYNNSAVFGGNSELDVTVELRQGVTTVASWTHTDIRNTSYETRNQTLSTSEADSITDYTDLRVFYDITFSFGSQSRQFRLTWVEFEVPGPLLPGKNDTAWFDFGYDLSPADNVSRVETGIEWYRTSPEPVLNVAVSWDNGLTWATNQTATNRSTDDDTVEWLDFTSATAWNASKLSDANLRVRVGTNASGARLDYVTVRVNFDTVLNLSLVSSAFAVDPGDAVTLTATVTNLGSGSARNILIEAQVDRNATYISSFPTGSYDGVTRTLSWAVPFLTPGNQVVVEWIVEVNLGTPDLATVTSSVQVDYEDVSGASLPSLHASSEATVSIPSFSPALRLDRSNAERGDEVVAALYYNNTGTGTALLAWANWSLEGHYVLAGISPALSYIETADGFEVALTNVAPGSHSMAVRLLVVRGMADGLEMGLQVTWEATDGNGNPLPDADLDSGVFLYAPSLSLSLGSAPTSVEAHTAFTLNLTIRNSGQAMATGWLNLTLPSGVEYVGDNGTYPVNVTDGLMTWKLSSVPAGSAIFLGVEFETKGEPGLESFRFSFDFTDGKGSSPERALSNAVSVELLPAVSPYAPWLWWVLGLVAAAATVPLFLLIRRFLNGPSIEEIFVVHRNGILLVHRSKTLTPDQDEDILAALFKTVQDFVQDAFSSHDDAPMRGLQFGKFNILIEQGTYHYVAVVYKGTKSPSLEVRLSRMSRRIDEEFGDVLKGWDGAMNEVKGIRHILPALWGGGKVRRKDKDELGRQAEIKGGELE